MQFSFSECGLVSSISPENFRKIGWKMNLRTENKREKCKSIYSTCLLSDFKSDFISELSVRSSICIPNVRKKIVNKPLKKKKKT